MGENLCQLLIVQRITNQNIQRAQKTKHQTNNQINKWAHELDSQFSKEVQNGQYVKKYTPLAIKLK
jgi:chromosome condensin MukBEF complex kleisin-like MukF subunit